VASTEVRLVPFSILYHGMMRRMTLKIEGERDQGAAHDYHHEVANVVVLAAFVMEAAINEVAYWLQAHLTQPIALPRNFQRSSVRNKWRTVPRRCGAPGFDERAYPWLDFEALVRLRNALVHADAYPRPPDGVLALLEAKGCVQPATDWFESIMTRRTARWACATASTMPLSLADMIAPYIDLRNGGFSWMWNKAWLPTIDSPPP
jgi:hypothetical protein